MQDVHHCIDKEPIGQGVFVDDPKKRKDIVVFRQDDLVMIYQGEATTHNKAAI